MVEHPLLVWWVIEWIPLSCCPSRHTVATIHISNNEWMLHPEAFQGLCLETVAAEHIFVCLQIQPNKLWSWTLWLSAGRDWMPMPIHLPYSHQECYSCSNSSTATSYWSHPDGPLVCGFQIYYIWRIPTHYHSLIEIEFFFIYCPNSTVWICDCSTCTPSN